MAAILSGKEINRIAVELSIESNNDAGRHMDKIREMLRDDCLDVKTRKILEFATRWHPKRVIHPIKTSRRFFTDGLLYVSAGNSKLNVPSWSVLAGLDCPAKTLLCYIFCYARKSQGYQAVVNARSRNKCAEQRPDFVARMVRLLRKINRKNEINMFRIYTAGDFADRQVYYKWCEICEAFPRIRFLVFTQMYVFAKESVPINMNRIWTVWPDTKLDTVPDGPRAYVGGGCLDRSGGYEIPSILNYYAEPIAFKCHGQCGVDCKRCFGLRPADKDVFFDLH